MAFNRFAFKQNTANFLFITRENRQNPGARTRCFGFAEELKKRGFSASVFSFPDRVGAKSGRDEANFNLSEKLRCVFKGCKLLLREPKPSAFIINRFNYHSIPAWLVSMFKKIPFIFDMDDWEARESSGSKAEYLTRIFARKSIFCIAASRYLRDYLLRFNKDVYYIPTAVDTDAFRPSAPKENRNFIFSWHGSVNRPELTEYIKFIMDCFLTLYEKYPFIKLHIAADGIFRKELLSSIKSYSCEAIVYKGWMPYENIPSYLDDIDCGLVPLLEKTRFNLSKSPVKLFEYMAKAKPVIASPVGEAAYIIKENSNGFLGSTKDEFILKMEHLIKDAGLAKKTGTTARKEIEEKYSMNVIGEELVKIFKDFFNNSPY